MASKLTTRNIGLKIPTSLVKGAGSIWLLMVKAFFSTVINCVSIAIAAGSGKKIEEIDPKTLKEILDIISYEDLIDNFFDAIKLDIGQEDIKYFITELKESFDYCIDNNKPYRENISKITNLINDIDLKNNEIKKEDTDKIIKNIGIKSQFQKTLSDFTKSISGKLDVNDVKKNINDFITNKENWEMFKELYKEKYAEETLREFGDFLDNKDNKEESIQELNEKIQKILDNNSTTPGKSPGSPISGSPFDHKNLNKKNDNQYITPTQK